MEVPSLSVISPLMPRMEPMIEVDSDYLKFFAFTMLILTLCVRTYIIGMIWACYKYVQQVAFARKTFRENKVDPDTEVLLPPRYEDAPTHRLQPVNQPVIVSSLSKHMQTMVSALRIEHGQSVNVNELTGVGRFFICQ